MSAACKTYCKCLESLTSGILCIERQDLKFGEFVGFELIPAQNQTDDVLGKQSERSEIQHFVAVLIDKFQNLLTNL